MKIRTIIFSLLVLFLMAGCTIVDQGNIKIEEEYYSFPAYIHVDGQDYEITRGGYEWKTKLKSGVTRVITTDHAGPYQMSSSIEAIHLEPNKQVTIKIKGKPQLELYLWNETGRYKKYELKQNEFTTHGDKGEYIFEIFSKWKNGEASYTFVVEIQ
ncbi:hypothetical protein [Bacillus sp. FJAT-27245]|uniref:hypothetical protein n=1 Tax=Bacillus sp. FJAT-27245 TaxID=1684144 RepID=UPI0006A7A69F|nr:hypothetical protein [Bacillus sp. FJAT-27245]